MPVFGACLWIIDLCVSLECISWIILWTSCPDKCTDFMKQCLLYTGADWPLRRSGIFPGLVRAGLSFPVPAYIIVISRTYQEEKRLLPAVSRAALPARPWMWPTTPNHLGLAEAEINFCYLFAYWKCPQEAPRHSEAAIWQLQIILVRCESGMNLLYLPFIIMACSQFWQLNWPVGPEFQVFNIYW